MGLTTAVHRSKPLSRAGMLERLFTLAFSGLVYPQIWEDPVVDMEALDLRPDDHVVAIASGSCNILSYLTANPAKISAVDLNGAHIALGKLKLAALDSLAGHEEFLRFFGEAQSQANVALYDAEIAPRLDGVSRSYWEGRSLSGRRRIQVFARNFYRYGLLGRFIGAGHLLGRTLGCDPRVMLQARDMAEQRALFDRHIAPVFDKPLVRWLVRQPASLYGLGIPPAQYKALAADGDAGIRGVLRHRLERLACGFDLKSNYFARQAFGRGYATDEDASLPPYLERRNFAAVRERAGRVAYHQSAITAYLESQPAKSCDAYVLLDAQDWMNDADLTALWTQITRTARPGARVIFRTAADERLLPGRVPASILGQWRYEEARSRELGERDRSSIYGAFHLHVLQGAAA
ncbi:S-adenosylmethionine:diacylglycerol 3-amino-3-carboxypropyl transferase [Bosea sp. BIWAKO-01]|nr:S-adenosylmethionine:diacylglycerol 3-amino-3-carboxypropyl transferase [Bosea sp. BIWAKO-01]